MASNQMTARELVGREIRRAREAKGLSRVKLAKMFPVSESLVAKWEYGRGLPIGRDFKSLVEFLAIPEDSARIIAEIANELVSKEISPQWFKLPAVEAEATLLWTFEATIIPGLLQTEDYCHTIQYAANLPTDPDERVRSQLARQETLTKEDPVKYVALISESVLRHNVGGPKVMYDQVLHLASMAERENIIVHIIPDKALACAGFISAFVIASLDDGDVAYVDNQLNGDMIESGEDIARLRGHFDDFRADALNRQDSIDFIRRMAEEWQE